MKVYVIKSTTFVMMLVHLSMPQGNSLMKIDPRVARTRIRKINEVSCQSSASI